MRTETFQDWLWTAARVLSDAFAVVGLAVALVWGLKELIKRLFQKDGT